MHKGSGMGKRQKELLLVLSVAFVGLALLWLRTDKMIYTHPDFANPWDHHKYIFMASHNPFDFHIAPFCWRVLNPLFAKALPFDLQTNFAILTFVTLWITAPIFYLMLQRMGFSNELSFLGFLFFLTLGYAVRFNIYDFWLTDPLGFLFSVTALWSIFASKDILFAMLLAIGVLAKESVIFVTPLYYTFNAQRLFVGQLIIRTLILVSPAIFIMILLRVAIPPLNGNPQYSSTIATNLRDDNPYSLVWLLKNIGWARIQKFSLVDLWRYSGGTFGVTILFFSFFSIKNNLPYLVKVLPYLGLVYSSLLFAVNTNRVIVAAFPVVIPMALLGIKDFSEYLDVDSKLFVPLPLLIFYFVLLNNYRYMISPILEIVILLLYLAFIPVLKRWVLKK